MKPIPEMHPTPSVKNVFATQAMLDNAIDFELPPELEAHVPPEVRGLARDDVRLMVSYRSTDQITHTHFHTFPQYLEAGDVLVINTSATMKAGLKATRSDGMPLVLHLSTRLPNGQWIVELRSIDRKGATAPFLQAKSGENIRLPLGASATLNAPHGRPGTGSRLWQASLDLSSELGPYLNAFGSPIRYGYVPSEWSIEYYQTVYATEAGSAEMPSAGRAFTTALITRLVAQGTIIAPILLHTGVASQEAHEAPYEEYFRITNETARVVNSARSAGRRVIATGTTSIRALESAVDADGWVQAAEGWTDLIITPKRRLQVVDGLLTGLHEPRATHLAMLEALAGRGHIRTTYASALNHGYHWHEFGDLHLILP